MKPALLVFALLLLGLAAAMLWQHRRYLHARRVDVQDRQPLLYGSGAFHVVTFLRVEEGADPIEAVRKLKAATASLAGVEWVYAGKTALVGAASRQIGEVDWSAVVVLQFPSREAYESASRTETWRQALARFERTYAHGFVRSAAFNLLLPQLLLARRAAQIATREPSHFPFTPKPGVEREAEVQERISKLLSERELGARAVAVVNLVKPGTPEQRAADRGYVSRMLAAMAEGGYGPVHIGRAVPVEGSRDFDRVAIVYYPGVEFFADMVRSEFFQGIIGGKQLGDTQAVVTVPILDLL